MPLEDRRAALVSATEPLLERYGRDVSTRQIAEAAGVAEGTIFRAFATKDELIDAVIEEVFDEQRARDAILAIDRSQPLQQRLVTAVAILQERTRRVFALFHALRLRPGWAHADGEDPPAHETLRAKQEHDREQLELVLVDLIGRDADQLRFAPLEAVTALRAAVFSLTHPLLGDESLARPDRIVDLVLHGIARTPTPPSPSPSPHHTEETSC
ncbi:DNA-binding transcriptional regulator, AcrR family [Microlunatus flavus]|uniref:DNA-binding transcriptional regulator, AcrR family n=2 Tax=Microlunatus flavus TaxID=1036181 RepID=A0A1H9AZP3_9ACTN|nr:DNA-binding transcriptional regulator, AcrR family [Microlunatus flavus]